MSARKFANVFLNILKTPQLSVLMFFQNKHFERIISVEEAG